MKKKIKTLSDEIFKWGTFENSAIPTYDVKNFIAKLKEEISESGAKNVVKDIRNNCAEGYGIEYRILFRIINNLAGEKLI